MTLRVAAITTGSRTPSSRFRVRQHIKPLRDYDIVVREFIPVVDDRVESALRFVHPKSVRIRDFPPAYPFYAAHLAARVAAHLPGIVSSRRYDVTWLSRGLCEGWHTLESKLGKPLVLDVDDAIWLREPFGERQARGAAQRADVVVVCNDYLAEWFAPHCKRIEHVATAVDGEVFFPVDTRADDRFVIGWTGTSSNFRYLANMRHALAAFLRHAPDARLRIVADARPTGLELPEHAVEFVRWSEADEARAVQTMDVGIMPLVDDAWTRGKCAFKVIQYMACGLPVVASPYGMNAEAMGCGTVGMTATTDQQWLDALVFLYEQRDEARRIGAAARRAFLERFDLPVATRKLAEIFLSLRPS
jgi:glycosyltransferase involved in cell wall biosynthesis